MHPNALLARCAVPFAPVLLALPTLLPAQVVVTQQRMLQPRIGHQLAFDGQRVLLVGGTQSTTGNDFDDVWAFDGATWSLVGSVVDNQDAVAFDAVRSRLVAVRTNGSVGLAMQEWDGSSWSHVVAPPSLSFCSQHQVAYDPVRGACIVYGHEGTAGVTELWSYGTGGWQQLAGGPGANPGRGTYRIVPVPNGDVLCIGWSWGTNGMATWRWSGGTWSLVPATPAVDVFAFDVTHDPLTLQPVLVGYLQPGVLTAHVFAGGSWTLVGAGGPDVGDRFRVVHDGRRTLLFGGVRYQPVLTHLGDTWALENGVWSRVAGATPLPLRMTTACFDAARQRTVLVGWHGNERQTWEWDGAAMTLRHASSGTPRVARAAFDRARARTVLLDSDGRTLEWDGAAWQQVGGPGFGPATLQPAIAWDGRQIVAYAPRDTWTYDGLTWTRRFPAQPAPFDLQSPQLAEDPRRGRVVLLGSQSVGLYEWDGSTWRQAAPVPWPASRAGFVVGYHPARGRVFVCGGYDVTVTAFGIVTSPVHDLIEWDGAAFAVAGQFARRMTDAAVAAMPDGGAMVFGDYTPSAHFDVVTSAHPARIAPAGAGCASAAGVTAIRADPGLWPLVGDVLRLRAAPLPPATAAVLWALGARNDVAQGLPLPLDLAPFGAPGCALHVAPDAVLVTGAASSGATLSIALPAQPALVGARLFAQAMVPAAGTNAAGFVVSDAIAATLGLR